MHIQWIYVLVTCLISICFAIRVDFNTNQGPIIPPTPRTTVAPMLPYRDPAPVWEEQSNDIPNPNQYIYLLPLPSRPSPPVNNYGTTWPERSLGYENLLLTSDENTSFQNGNTNWGSGTLAAKYIPNVGTRFTSVVGSPSNRNNNYDNSNNAVNDNFNSNKKLHGKYNEKTKKYKAYEKVKYVPQNFFPHLQLALPIDKPYIPIFNNYQQFIPTQQLPHLNSPATFQPIDNVDTEAAGVKLNTSPSAAPTTTTTIASIITSKTAQSKLAHEKDQMVTKSKFNSWKQLKASSNTAAAAVGQKANTILNLKSR